MSPNQRRLPNGNYHIFNGQVDSLALYLSDSGEDTPVQVKTLDESIDKFLASIVAWTTWQPSMGLTE